MQSPSYIVFQAYGNEQILMECAYALLTLCRHHQPGDLDNLEVWIYTDKEEWFQRFKDCPLQLRFRSISMQQVQQWRGATDFVHRVKIEVLRDFVSNHEGAVMYLDTDICFMSSVSHVFSNISKGELYMHVQESRVCDEADPLMKKLHRFLEKNKPLTVGSRPVAIPQDIMMWNAGMLGFHTKYAHLLDDVLQFTDDVHARFPKHVVEQFAFSLYFQQAGFVHSTAAAVFHYWNFKEMRVYLQSFFDYFKDASWNDLVRYSDMIQPYVQLQYMISFYRGRNCLEKLRRVAWVPQPPDWAQLLQQMH